MVKKTTESGVDLPVYEADHRAHQISSGVGQKGRRGLRRASTGLERGKGAAAKAINGKNLRSENENTCMGSKTILMSRGRSRDDVVGVQAPTKQGSVLTSTITLQETTYPIETGLNLLVFLFFLAITSQGAKKDHPPCLTPSANLAYARPEEGRIRLIALFLMFDSTLIF
jgi:hypothetical protein